MSADLVSIVVASYNRSYVLGPALESVRAQTHSQWEVIVVDDGSGDDTEAVVERFRQRDPRFRFQRMAANCGEQSGPNNVGVDLAAGEFVAFLNQDDWWFPDHLERALAFLRQHGADLAISGAFFPIPAGFEADEPEHLERIQVAFQGIGLDYHWRPEMECPASSWLLRKSLHQALGGWRPASASTYPSQDFLFRAWQAGNRILLQQHASVICFASGMRTDSYRQRRSPEHEFLLGRLARRTDFRERLLERALYLQGNIAFKRKYQPSREELFGSMVKPLAFRVAARFGRHARILWRQRRHRREGGFIGHLRKIRGLDPRP